MSDKKFAILQQIAISFAATDNIRLTADLMLELALNYTNAEKGSLMLLNDKDELVIFTARGIESHLIRTCREKIGEGIAGVVAQQRLPVLVEDIKKDKRFKGEQRGRYKTRSFISCPILSKNKLLGVLNINDKTDNTAFTEDEFTLIKIMADQAAIALENASLLNQIRTKASELEDINRKLIESDLVKTEFLIRISHELRTPLNAVKGSIYYLQKSDNASQSEQKDFYGIIADETDRLIHVVENLLDFLRLEDEARVMKKSIISLPAVLNDIAKSHSLKTFLVRKNLNLVVNMPGNAAHFVGDKTRVSQLFTNLIEGLSVYLQEDDSITITVDQGDFIQVLLMCSREIPDSLIPSLFQPKNLFQDGDSEESLKLYLAQKAIERHKWSVRTENRDKAFCVCIGIPESTSEQLDVAVNTTTDLFIDFISDMLDVDICSIMLGDDFTGELTIRSARGLDDEVINRTRIKIGDSIAGWVALEGRPLFIEDIERDVRFMRKNVTQYDTKSLISVPIKVHDKVIGVINLNNKKTKSPFTVQDFFAASMISERVSFFFEKLYSGDLSEGALKEFLTSFDDLISAGRKYQKKRTAAATLIFQIMDRLGATEREKKTAVYISLIYDLGLTPLDKAISKKTKLTSEEARIVKLHPYTTVDLLSQFEFSDEVKGAILHHHESYDGTGYPEGLKVHEIPLISRVLHVVDSFCALTTERPYCKAVSQRKAMEKIKQHAGSMYDPVVVEALENVITPFT